MARTHTLEVLSLCLGIVVVTRSVLLEGVAIGVSTGLPVLGGLLFALAGLYGIISSEDVGEELPHPFTYLIAFGVFLYAAGMADGVVF